MADNTELVHEMISWRRDFHSNPEFGFEETRTSKIVAAKLREFGFDDVVEGVGGTGVVGTLKRGSGNRSIALRADMDALLIPEQGGQAWSSLNPGIMHACGHDGHTAMLMGAAKRLALEGGFDGTVRFIFQPAEEWGKGALAMLRDGLMDRFPFEEIYGIHNMPGLPVGAFCTRPGPIMSAEDNFEITLRGLGGHASRPHVGREALVAACNMVVTLQTIIARRIDPSETALVSVTEIVTDGTRNSLPSLAQIRGDARTFSPDVSAKIEQEMRVIADGLAHAYNLEVEVEYTREFVPTLNDSALTDEVLAAASDVFGADNVSVKMHPETGSEDFAQFLAKVPGCYAFVGNGNSAPLHNRITILTTTRFSAVQISMFLSSAAG